MEEPLNSEKPINTPDITDVNLTKFIVSTMDFNYLLQVEAALLPEHLLLPELHPLLLLFDDPRQSPLIAPPTTPEIIPPGPFGIPLTKPPNTLLAHLTVFGSL